MIRQTTLALACCLVHLACAAQTNAGASNGQTKASPQAAGKFFYSFPEEADDQWAYAIPECVAVPEPSKLANCTAFEKHQMCESSKEVELTSALSKEKRKFKLLYHVFNSKKSCVQNRQAALNGS